MSSAPPARPPRPSPAPGSHGARTAGHVPELDGIRGIAIALVLVHHFAPTTGVWGSRLAFTDIGWIGVDLFFVLSGYLITGILLDSVDREDYYRRFYLRRTFRIFPLYYTLLVSTLLFISVWQGGAYLRRVVADWGSPAWLFLYLGNIVSSIKGVPIPIAPLGPTWSLHIEEQFYACFPFLVRRLRHRLWVLLVALIVGALAWRIATYLLNPANIMAQRVGTLSRADGLAAGALAAFAMRHLPEACLRRLVRWLVPIALAGLIAFYASVGVNSDEPLTRTVGLTLDALAFVAIVLGAVLYRNRAVTAPLRSAPLRFLGRISYGLYLLQLPVAAAIKLLRHDPLGSLGRTPLQSASFLGATIVIATLSWYAFEKPFLDWGSRSEAGRSASGGR